jgi:rare lipoprotein A
VRRILTIVLVGIGLASCATVEHVAVTPVPDVPEVVRQQGTAVYYASRFHGRRTASGVRLDNTAMVAAHPSLPFGCVVGVTNLRDGRSVDVKIIDRGPSPSGQRRGIIIDVSQAAARELGFFSRGTAEVELRIPTRCGTGKAD